MEKKDLTKEEKQVLEEYQEKISVLLTHIGAVRREYLAKEQSILMRIDENEKEFNSLVQIFAKNKNIPEKEEWMFDIKTMSFIKQ